MAAFRACHSTRRQSKTRRSPTKSAGDNGGKCHHPSTACQKRTRSHAKPAGGSRHAGRRFESSRGSPARSCSPGPPRSGGTAAGCRCGGPTWPKRAALRRRWGRQHVCQGASKCWASHGQHVSTSTQAESDTRAQAIGVLARTSHGEEEVWPPMSTHRYSPHGIPGPQSQSPGQIPSPQASGGCGRGTPRNPDTTATPGGT